MADKSKLNICRYIVRRVTFSMVRRECASVCSQAPELLEATPSFCWVDSAICDIVVRVDVRRICVLFSSSIASPKTAGLYHLERLLAKPSVTRPSVRKDISEDNRAEKAAKSFPSCQLLHRDRLRATP